MITDKLENINKYSVVSEKVSDFLKGLTPYSETGHYEIDERAYANIDVYSTKDINICKFEAHKKFIDIQMLLSGEERLDCAFRDELAISLNYDEERDVMFFYSPEKDFDSVFLKPSKFVILFPNDAHRPQIKSGDTDKKVKKVVVKIKL